MDYQDIPDYTTFEAWQNQYGEWEVKFYDRFRNVLLHLSEDRDAKDSYIEDGKFYLSVENNTHGSIEWIRERQAFEMEYDTGTTIDSDYVTLYDDGKRSEHQHNHLHLDAKVQRGETVALTEA
jgi:hypothetical protein